MALFFFTPKQEYEKALDYYKKWEKSNNSKYFNLYLEHLSEAADQNYPEALYDYSHYLTKEFTQMEGLGINYLKKAADANNIPALRVYSQYLIEKSQKEEAYIYLNKLPKTEDNILQMIGLIKEKDDQVIQLITTNYSYPATAPTTIQQALINAYKNTKQEERLLDLLIKRYQANILNADLDLIQYYVNHNQKEKAIDIRIEIAEKNPSRVYQLYDYIKDYPNKLYHFFTKRFQVHTLTTLNNLPAVVFEVEKASAITVNHENASYAYGLALCYYYGYGTSKKVDEAIILFSKVFEINKNSDLALILANHYYDQKNYTNAAKYFNSYPGRLPMNLYEGMDKKVYLQKAKTYFETKDYVKAFDYLNKALPQADQNPFIYDHLARCYINGWGTTRDDVKGFEYTKKAASLDYPEGIHLLGYCYAMGRGVPKDEKKAYDIYTETEAKYHLPQTQRNIGILYAYGQAGLKKDYYEARAWFTKAANQNYDLGKQTLEWINNKIKEELEHPDLPCVESQPYE